MVNEIPRPLDHSRLYEAEQMLTKSRELIAKIFSSYYDASSSDEDRLHHFIERLYSRVGKTKVDWVDESFLKRKFPELQRDPIPLIIYKQLCYQLQFVKSGYSAAQYANANANFADFFTLFLRDDEEPVDYAIPAYYIWNVIDQYIDLYESFYLACKDIDDPNYKLDDCWNELAMLNVLFSFIDKSKVIDQLDAIKEGRDPLPVAGKFGKTGLYKAFGYYSLIGLLRLFSSNGDYFQAIKSLEHTSLDISNQKKFTGQVNHCITTTFYYAGFCYLMTHRYIEAIKVLCEGMRVIFEVGNPECRDICSEFHLVQNRLILNQGKKMCYLLALALSLFPYQINEMILNEVKDVVGEHFAELQAGDSSAYRFAFREACPCFFSLNLNKSLDEILNVYEQRNLPPLRSRLRDYSSIDIQRLADLLDTSKTATIEVLLNLKHKMSLVDNKVDGSNGYVTRSLSDLDFYIAGDIIYISHMKQIRHYGSNLVEQIGNLSKVQRRTVDVLKKMR